MPGRLGRGLDVLEHLSLAPGHSIVEVEAPEWTLGKTVRAGKQRRLLIVALLSQDEVTVAPTGDESIRPGDRLTLIGRDDDVSEFRNGAA